MKDSKVRKKHFRDKVIDLNLLPSWGNSKVDLLRIENEINDKMANVIVPREFPDLGFWYYNKHDRDHIKRVINYLWEILKKKRIKLRDHEYYLLYIAAYGHDLGMTIWDDSLKEVYERALGKRMDTSLMRKAHGVAGGNILEEILEPYIKNPEIRGAIKEIVSYHCGEIPDIAKVPRERTIDRKKIRIGLLIALLRIADTMDAGEQRLPDEEIIATSLALSSTCEPFQGQFEHYMRRKIIESCHYDKCDKMEGIVLTIRQGFRNFEIKSPAGKKGKSICVTGKDAFLGVLEEFGKELGSPENLDELKKEFPDLAWNKLENVWEKQTSNRLLEKYNLKIPWIVKFSGHPSEAIPVKWKLKAKEKREKYDEEPHPIEIFLAKKGIIKPPIESLMLIREALAAQDIKPDPFRPGRLFWPDIKRLLRRDEIDKICKCFTKHNVVLMEGYPASGKSSIVCRLGYELVKEGKWVYYGNLTTRAGLRCQLNELPDRLLEEVKEIEGEVFIIIEDIHHMVKEFDRLNPIANQKNIKLLLTSRPLKQYDIEEYFSRREGKSFYFQWIVPENKIEVKTDKDVVEKILREAGSSFSNLDSILETIGKKQPNLLLLSFLIQAYQKEGKRKQIDEIKEKEIRESVINYLNELKESICDTSQEQEAFEKLIGTLSVLSEFEVPVERKFIDNGVVGNLLKKLEKKKEILSLKGKFFGQEYYFIPHSRLASLYRNVCFDEKQRREVLKRYIIQGNFFGTLIKRLIFEAKSLLKSLIKELKKELIKRELSHANIEEIRYFLRGIAQADKKIAREIANKHSETLRQRFSQANIKDTGYFLWGIASVDQKLARKIASECSDILKQKISQASIKEIGDFLRVITWVDQKLAKDIINEHSDILKQKDLSQASIIEIGDFLWGIASVDQKLARKIASEHSDILKQKDLSQASIIEIGDFLRVITWVDQKLAKDIINEHSDILKQKDLSQASIIEIGEFLRGIASVDQKLARKIASEHSDILKQKISLRPVS